MLQPGRTPPVWRLALVLALLAAAGSWVAAGRSSDVHAQRAEARALAAQGDLAGAQQVLERALAEAPDGRTALQLAALQSRAAQPLRAEVTLRTALRGEPNGPGAAHLKIALARLLRARGRSAEAAELLRALTDEGLPELDLEARVEVHLIRGAALADLGQLRVAEPLLREAARLRQAYGFRARESGDRQVAALLALGEALVRADVLDEAERVLRGARQIAPDAVRAHLLLAAVLEAGGRWDEAASLLKALYQQVAGRAIDRGSLVAGFLVHQGRHEQALALANDLRAEGRDEDARAAEALVSLRAVAAGVPLGRGELELLVARIACTAADLPRAEAALRKALRLDPDLQVARVALEQLAPRPIGAP